MASQTTAHGVPFGRHHPVLERGSFVSASPKTPTPADGKLGVLIVGLGAVTTTLLAGVELARKGMGQPVGALSQLATIRLGKRTDDRSPLIKDFVPIADLNDLVFQCWDPFEDDAYVSAQKAGVLEAKDIEPIGEFLRSVQPVKAAFDRDYVKNLAGTHTKVGNKREQIESLRADIREFKESEGCDRLVMLWAASTEKFIETSAIHLSIESLEAAIDANDPAVAPSMLYAYAAITEGVPFINGAPNLTLDTPAMMQLVAKHKVPVCGKDFKTGQTMIKTVLAPMFKTRMLGMNGWFSTNILGNRDGEVLDDPENFKSKEVSKLSVLEHILEPDKFPDLYGDLYHKVRINYYPPRGDDKEGWDNIDFFGWLGYKMQIKVDFLCKDSILAAPLCLDLILFTDLAQRAGMHGIQEWLSFYFKAPQVAPGLYPEHDLFIQKTKLKNTLRWMMGEEVVSHLGREYYDDED
ncbi:MAG: myo-inositol-1-phosphate synthase, partial [Glaciecola sp.]